MAERRSGAVTLMDVAREAEVSLATASRALSGSTRRVRPDLHLRVLDAASKLSYSANAQARAMVRGETTVVGLLVHDIADPYFSSIAAGVMRAAEGHGLLVTIASTERRPERELEYVATLRSQRARALILVGSRDTDAVALRALGVELAAFEAAGGRVAMISQKRLPVDTVSMQNRAGAQALARELVRRGHRDFAVLAGPADLLTARDRLAGFRQGLAAAGVSLAPPCVIHGQFTRDGGYAATSELLDAGAGVTCIFAVNDVMAVGAMASMRDRKIRLPQRMAVAGFDDIVTLRDVTPSLTTVRMPLESVGADALDLVMQPRADRARVHRVQGEVVMRESTPFLT